MWHERDDFKIRLVARAVNARLVLDWCRGAGQRATAASELRGGDVNARRPRGTRGRSAALVAESVDVAEHSATLDCAMDGGLSAGSEGSLRAALHDVHMPRLNPDEQRRQNPRVIHSASQLACARVRAADRGDVGHAAHGHQQRRRRRARDGVNDPPIADGGTLRVRGMGSFTPSLVLYSRRCSPCRAAQTAARTRRCREPVARSRNGLRLIVG